MSEQAKIPAGVPPMPAAFRKIPIRAQTPAKAPAPTQPFNPRAIIAQTAQKKAEQTEEARKKEEVAIAEDVAKYSAHVGGTFQPKDPQKQAWEIRVIVFQARINLGPGGPRPGFLIERIKPHSSWWVPAQVFLDTHNKVGGNAPSA